MPATLVLLALGLLGSILMFAGDMLLYFTPGAYHAQYVYLSVIAKAGREELYDEVAGNIMFVMRFATAPMYLGFVVLGVAIVLGQTVFPARFVVLTPLVTSLLGLVWMRVPQPARCVLFGGWSNLVFTIMFAAMLVCKLAG